MSTEFETVGLSLQDYTLYMLDCIRKEVSARGVTDIEIDQSATGPLEYKIRIGLPNAVVPHP